MPGKSPRLSESQKKGIEKLKKNLKKQDRRYSDPKASNVGQKNLPKNKISSIKSSKNLSKNLSKNSEKFIKKNCQHICQQIRQKSLSKKFVKKICKKNL